MLQGQLGILEHLWCTLLNKAAKIEDIDSLVNYGLVIMFPLVAVCTWLSHLRFVIALFFSFLVMQMLKNVPECFAWSWKIQICPKLPLFVTPTLLFISTFFSGVKRTWGICFIPQIVKFSFITMILFSLDRNSGPCLETIQKQLSIFRNKQFPPQKTKFGVCFVETGYFVCKRNKKIGVFWNAFCSVLKD